MIYVKRPACPPLSIYVVAGSKKSPAEVEIASAVTFFTDKKNYHNNVKLCERTFGFRIYRNPELKDYLETVFNGKCAYCESTYAHVTSLDVEHFRPKAEIATATGVELAPGYFWLGNEWTNLLASCPDCNRSRRHRVPGQTERILLGKGTQFPLDDERARVRHHEASLHAEEPVRLLIDPCKDNPEQLLRFDVEGLVHPVFGESVFEGRKGKISIEAYALQRKPLVEERKKHLIDLIKLIGDIRYQLNAHHDLVEDGVAQARIDGSLEQLDKLIDRARSMLASRSPYLAMLRGYILAGTKNGDFADIERFGVDLVNLIQ